MDLDQGVSFPSGLKLASEQPIEESGWLGTHRGWTNIRWYEYVFLFLGLIAVLISDGLTIARLLDVGSLQDPDFAYVFLLSFLITGIFYQRITDIAAFLLSAVLLTVYVVTHYFTRNNPPISKLNAQDIIRLVRLIFTVMFNLFFIPLSLYVIKDYQREEFSKRLFGAFAADRLPLKIYSIFDCVVRINTMLSISSLILNLYNYTGYETADRVLLFVGIFFAILWLGMALGMARLETLVLAVIFYCLSIFQIGFLVYCLITAVRYSKTISQVTTTTLSPTTISLIITRKLTVSNIVPILPVLYVCISFNLLTHVLAMILGGFCISNFNKGLKKNVFNSKLDKRIQQRWSRS